MNDMIRLCCVVYITRACLLPPLYCHTCRLNLSKSLLSFLPSFRCQPHRPSREGSRARSLQPGKEGAPAGVSCVSRVPRADLLAWPDGPATNPRAIFGSGLGGVARAVHVLGTGLRLIRRWLLRVPREYRGGTPPVVRRFKRGV